MKESENPDTIITKPEIKFSTFISWSSITLSNEMLLFLSKYFRWNSWEDLKFLIPDSYRVLNLKWNFAFKRTDLVKTKLTV
jgi:hypothetical protein